MIYVEYCSATMTEEDVRRAKKVVVDSDTLYSAVANSNMWRLKSERLRFFTDPKTNLYYGVLPEIAGFIVSSKSLLEYLDSCGEVLDTRFDYGAVSTDPLGDTPIPTKLTRIEVELVKI